MKRWTAPSSVLGKLKDLFAAPRPQRAARKWNSALMLEALEERAMLTTTLSLTNDGTQNILNIVIDGADETLNLSASATTLYLESTVSIDPGTTGFENGELDRSLFDKIVVTGGDDTQTLAIDHADALSSMDATVGLEYITFLDSAYIEIVAESRFIATEALLIDAHLDLGGESGEYLFEGGRLEKHLPLEVTGGANLILRQTDEAEMLDLAGSIYGSVADLSRPTGNVTIEAMNIRLGATIYGEGNLIFRPFAADREMNLGGDGTHPGFTLSSDELFAIKDGFASVTFGSEESVAVATIRDGWELLDVTTVIAGSIVVADGVEITSNDDVNDFSLIATAENTGSVWHNQIEFGEAVSIVLNDAAAVSLTTDHLLLNAANPLTLTAQRLNISTYDATLDLRFGDDPSADAGMSYVLGIPLDVFDRTLLDVETLQLSANSITLTDFIDLTDSFDNLVLLANYDIVLATPSAHSLAVSGLRAESELGSIQLNPTGFAAQSMDIDTFTARVNDGNVTLWTSGDLTIGTVDGVSGIVSAGGDLNAARSVDIQSFDGTVTLAADAAILTGEVLNRIPASVSITAAAGITIAGLINTNGADGDATNAPSQGGAITLETTTGNIVVEQTMTANGGDATTASSTAGAGGVVTLTASNGSILLEKEVVDVGTEYLGIEANGGSFTGAGLGYAGLGGQILLTSQGVPDTGTHRIVTGALSANGGDHANTAANSNASGGGTIALSIVVGTIEVHGDVSAVGGTAGGGRGGAGGTFSAVVVDSDAGLTSGISISSPIDVSGGAGPVGGHAQQEAVYIAINTLVDGSVGTGNVQLAAVSANGGASGAGDGDGGMAGAIVVLNAATGSITTGFLSAVGSAAGSASTSAAGGDGNSITVSTAEGNVIVSGANAGGGDSYGAADAGDAGSIYLGSEHAELNFDVLVEGDLDANGGVANLALTNSGMGGDGGLITLLTINGSLEVQGYISARGGESLGLNGGYGGGVRLTVSHLHSDESNLIKVSGAVDVSAGDGATDGGSITSKRRIFVSLGDIADVGTLVPGEIDLQGNLSANGGNSTGLSGSGGSAGKISIEIADGTIATEAIAANGGDGTGTGNGGDAGAIVITSHTLTVETLGVSTEGGNANGTGTGGAGNNITISAAEGYTLGGNLIASSGVGAAGNDNSAGDVTLTGNVTLVDSVTVFAVGAAGEGAGNVTFENQVDAAHEGLESLTVSANGVTHFMNAVGKGTQLGSVRTDAGGTTQFGANGELGYVETANEQLYLDNITFGVGHSANTELVSRESNIQFQDDSNVANLLQIDSGWNLQLNSATRSVLANTTYLNGGELFLTAAGAVVSSGTGLFGTGTVTMTSASELSSFQVASGGVISPGTDTDFANTDGGEDLPSLPGTLTFVGAGVTALQFLAGSSYLAQMQPNGTMVDRINVQGGSATIESGAQLVLSIALDLPSFPQVGTNLVVLSGWAQGQFSVVTTTINNSFGMSQTIVGLAPSFTMSDFETFVTASVGQVDLVIKYEGGQVFLTTTSGVIISTETVSFQSVVTLSVPAVVALTVPALDQQTLAPFLYDDYSGNDASQTKGQALVAIYEVPDLNFPEFDDQNADEIDGVRTVLKQSTVELTELAGALKRLEQEPFGIYRIAITYLDSKKTKQKIEVEINAKNRAAVLQQLNSLWKILQRQSQQQTEPAVQPQPTTPTPDSSSLEQTGPAGSTSDAAVSPRERLFAQLQQATQLPISLWAADLNVTPATAAESQPAVEADSEPVIGLETSLATSAVLAAAALLAGPRQRAASGRWGDDADRFWNQYGR